MVHRLQRQWGTSKETVSLGTQLRSVRSKTCQRAAADRPPGTHHSGVVISGQEHCMNGSATPITHPIQGGAMGASIKDSEPPGALRSFEELGAALGHNRAKHLPIDRKLDEVSRTKQRFDRRERERPFTATTVGRALFARYDILQKLAGYIESGGCENPAS